MYCVFTYTTPAGKTKHEVRTHLKFASKADIDAVVESLKAAGNTNITWRYC